MSAHPTVPEFRSRVPRRTCGRRAGPRFAPLLAALAVLVAACAQDAGDYSAAQAPKDLQVQWVTLDHDVRFAEGVDVLDPRERVHLDAFLAQLALRPSDRFLLDIGPVAGRAVDPVRQARLDAVEQRIRRQLPGAAIVPFSGDGAPAGGLRLIVGRYVALPPNCPNWSRPSAANPGNLPDSNFGCATATNLGAMVADPADLLRGRDLAPADGTVMAAGVRRYRLGKVKDPRPETTTEGSGSGTE